MNGVDEFVSIYFAAACLAFWAGCGCCNVSDVQFADAVNMVCDDAELSVPQETLLKRLAHEMTRKEHVND